MDRQIKFRQPIYSTGGVFMNFHYWGFTAPNRFHGPLSNYNGGSVELAQKSSEQFTGLLDKNGKEIYEGDILLSELSGRPSLVEWSDGSGEWLGEPVGFMLVMRQGEAHVELDHGWAVGGEIIGNIHENPELLQSP
jgi:hypothetical protein